MEIHGSKRALWIVSAARPAWLIVAAWSLVAVVELLVSWIAFGPQLSLRLAVGESAALVLLWSLVTPVVVTSMDRLRRRSAPRVTRAAVHVVLLLIAMFLDTVVRRLALEFFGAQVVVKPAATMLYYADLVAARYLAIVFVADALAAIDQVVDRSLIADRLSAQLARARIDLLESQLQPHFLFNSLGTITELAYTAPERAARVVRQLRSAVGGTEPGKSDEVPLIEEIDALAPYLDIQRIRFSDWLQIDVVIAPETRAILVPRLILQPLVENALKHGLTGRTARGKLSIESRLQRDELIVRVVDNGHGLDASRAARPGHGIGLKNVRERLAILHGDGAGLRLFEVNDGATIAELRVPARRSVPSTGGELEDGPKPELTAPQDRHWSSFAVCAVWLGVGALWSQQSLAYLVMRGRLGGTSVGTVLASGITAGALWAMLTPLVFWLDRRVPLRPFRWPVLALHIVVAGVLSVAHAVLLRTLFHPELPFRTAYASVVVLNLIVFLIITAIGHRRAFLAWLRERELASARLRMDVELARVRADEARTDPSYLLEVLDRLAEVVVEDARMTERIVARLARYLRVSLEVNGSDRAAALFVARQNVDTIIGSIPTVRTS